ncbi:hypothetical protein ACPV5O_19900 [Vibrio maritimus]|uniref:Uncharacterized protein n=1 Tax=Vibrio maritimus TaxID=990268 RepID=A0A090S2H2_9VIBR|nr:hypothetical protein JCM19235_3706 [Vibrio maritimus]
MLLREFKHHFALGDIEGAIALRTRHSRGYYLLVMSSKWGVNSFLETGRDLTPRLFKTRRALLNTANAIGLGAHQIEVRDEI